MSDAEKLKEDEYRVEANLVTGDYTVIEGPNDFNTIANDTTEAHLIVKRFNALSRRVKEQADAISEGFSGYKESIEKPFIGYRDSMVRIALYCLDNKLYESGSELPADCVLRTMKADKKQIAKLEDQDRTILLILECAGFCEKDVYTDSLVARVVGRVESLMDENEKLSDKVKMLEGDHEKEATLDAELEKEIKDMGGADLDDIPAKARILSGKEIDELDNDECPSCAPLLAENEQVRGKLGRAIDFILNGDHDGGCCYGLTNPPDIPSDSVDFVEIFEKCEKIKECSCGRVDFVADLSDELTLEELSRIREIDSKSEVTMTVKGRRKGRPSRPDDLDSDKEGE